MNGSAAGGLWTGDFTSALEESAYDNKVPNPRQWQIPLPDKTSFVQPIYCTDSFSLAVRVQHAALHLKLQRES